MFEIFCILLVLAPFQQEIICCIDAKIGEFRRKKGNK